MINKTNLKDDEQVLSIVVKDGEKERVKERLLKKLPKMKKQLIAEDHEELIFLIPEHRGLDYSLNQIRMALNATGAKYQTSVRIAEHGAFRIPEDS